MAQAQRSPRPSRRRASTPTPASDASGSSSTFPASIWQGDANARALRCLAHCTVPTSPINISGTESLSIRSLAQELAARLGRPAHIIGAEAPTAWLTNTAAATALFGAPSVPLERMLDWTADWVGRGLPTLDKPTRFEVRDGVY